MTDEHVSLTERLALALAADPDLVEEMPIEDIQRELDTLKVERLRLLVLYCEIHRLIEETRLREAGYPPPLPNGPAEKPEARVGVRETADAGKGLGTESDPAVVAMGDVSRHRW
jgi:hypothetical protein